MRKEILFAIIAGCLFGLVIAFGIWKANTSIEKTAAGVEEGRDEGIKMPSATNEFAITIAKPENNQVLTKNPVKVSGLTKVNTWVSISTEENDYLTQATPNGSFEQDIELTGGVNEVIFHAYDENGKSSEAKMILVYSTEFEQDSQPETNNEN
jgi:hypothetical protein